MTQTKYNKEQGKFSDWCHELAQEQLYPKLWPELPLRFESTQFADGGVNAILDGHLGIDRIVYVTYPEFGEMPFRIQERFRSDEWRQKQDITITVFNNASGERSEFYKMAAELFVYGYVDGYPKNKRHPISAKKPKNIMEWLVINTFQMKENILNGKLPYNMPPSNDRKQDFFAVKFSDMFNIDGLIKRHCIIEYNW